MGASRPSPGSDGAVFVPAGSGGLLSPLPLLFGPDGNGNGHHDLYVGNADFTGLKGKNGNVKRFDGVTGAYLDDFVPVGSGGLNDPGPMTLTETDPVTLAYNGE